MTPPQPPQLQPRRRASELLLWLRATVAGRKWILWVSLLVLALVAFQIVLMLLPHHDLNTLTQYEEQANGVRHAP
jgi:hypothetical protein